MSAIFNDPPFFGGLCNPDIQANKNTPLDLGQGGSTTPTPPGNLPLMVLVGNNPTGIFVSIDPSSVTGTAPITYSCSYVRADGTGLTKTATLSTYGFIYIFSTTGGGDLENDTPYNFQVTATNAYGSVVGTLQEFSTTPAPPAPPGNLPALEQSIGSFPNTITLYFFTGAVTGAQPITYTCKYGLQTQGPITDVPVINTKPGDYEFSLVGLVINTPYVFQLTATNSVDATLGNIQTFEVDTTPLQPSGPPSIPISLGSTTSSITVSFDVDGITGSGTLEFSALYGTVTEGAVHPVEAVLLQDTLYEATAINLSPATSYVFKSVVTSSVESLSSDISAPIDTLA